MLKNIFVILSASCALLAGFRDCNSNSSFSCPLYNLDLISDLSVEKVKTQCNEFDSGQKRDVSSIALQDILENDQKNFLESEIDANSMSTESKTFTSNVESMYTIHFVTNCSVVILDQVYNGGELIIEPTEMMNDGYNFNGWFTTSDFSAVTKWNFQANTVKSDMTLYASWTKNEPWYLAVYHSKYFYVIVVAILVGISFIISAIASKNKKKHLLGSSKDVIDEKGKSKDK
jgi:uncharacterized repeat protein (TIGR02543 family)